MNDGDFIKISYEMALGDDKKVIATSDKKIAEDSGIYDEHFRYDDFVTIVGSDTFFKAINESFLKAKQGEEYSVEVEPIDAFGVRDPKNIRVHTTRELQRQNIDPEVGKEITLNQRNGRIISVTPGRIMVDYNHRYAGKAVHFKYKVLESIADETEKVKAIVTMNYIPNLSEFLFNLAKDTISIQIPDNAKFDPVWFEAKFRIVNQVRKYIPELAVQIQELYPKQEKPAEEPTESDKDKQTEVKGEKTEA